MYCNDAQTYTGMFYRAITRTNTGKCIYQYKNNSKITTVVGEKLPEISYPTTFIGKWVTTKQFGKQFHADMEVKKLPENAEQACCYIAAHKLGISKRQAQKMIELVSFPHLWNSIISDPLQFTIIEGITPRIIVQLQEAIADAFSQQNLFHFFGSSLSCNAKEYRKISSFFNDDGMLMFEKIHANPFILMDCGYEFERLDRFVAQQTSFASNDYRRLIAATNRVLLSAKEASHVGLPEKALYENLFSLLKKQQGVSFDDIRDFLEDAIRNNEIVFDKGLFYLPRAYKEETKIAELLANMANALPEPIERSEFDKIMMEYSEAKGFSLSPDQQNAVWTALVRKVCVITGGPGTGKSTILDAILYCWKHFFDTNWLLMAPTGKASVRMNETTQQNATTIHSCLGLDVTNHNIKDIDTNINTVFSSLIVIDESSMIDQTVMTSIMMSLSPDSTTTQHLIFVGDPEQLPSVGWGNVLSDLIASNVIPVRKLNTIYRQGKGNPIITNSAKILANDANLEWGGSFVRYNEGSDEANTNVAIKLYQRLVQKHGIENVVVLSPYNKATKIGTSSLNPKIQNALNPDVGQPHISAFGRIYRQGDRVMQLQNTRQLNNGDIGTITEINEKAKGSSPCVFVQFENGKTYPYIKDELNQLELAYAMTIHKSQGSQYKNVIIILPEKANSSFLRRNLLYTAITRSSANVAIISPTSTITSCIQNGTEVIRYTNLVARLRESIHPESLYDDDSAFSKSTTAEVFNFFSQCHYSEEDICSGEPA